MHNPYSDEAEQTPQSKKMGDILASRLLVPVKRNMHIHSEEHDLADQICKMYHEPKRFGFWLATIKRKGTSAVHRAWAEIRQQDVDNPARLLAWKLSKKAEKKPEEPLST